MPRFSACAIALETERTLCEAKFGVNVPMLSRRNTVSFS